MPYNEHYTKYKEKKMNWKERYDNTYNVDDKVYQFIIIKMLDGTMKDVVGGFYKDQIRHI